MVPTVIVYCSESWDGLGAKPKGVRVEIRTHAGTEYFEADQEVRLNEAEKPSTPFLPEWFREELEKIQLALKDADWIFNVMDGQVTLHDACPPHRGHVVREALAAVNRLLGQD